MISRITLIFVLMIYTSAYNTDYINRDGTVPKPQCQANRVYQKDDVTCFCNKYGRWPHRNCSLVFNQHPVCRPNSYVQIDCNICRCTEAGTIDKRFCTDHTCSAGPEVQLIHRRAYIGNKCEIDHWYALYSCRLCFCLNRDNLICSPEGNPKKLVLGKYNVTDCGAEWLRDINKLLSSIKPLRHGNIDENLDILDDTVDPESVNNKEKNQITPRPTNVPKDSPVSPNLNREIIGPKQEVKIARIDDKSEENDVDSTSESVSDEVVEVGQSIARITGNTAMPLENDDETGGNNSNENDRKQPNAENDRKDSDDENDSKQSGKEIVDIKREGAVEAASVVDKNEGNKVKNAIDDDSDESLLKINLPGMLGRVFNFGIRKSMVSITDSNCVPGTTRVVKCNTCFCLANHKMLCTKRNCE